MPAGSGPQVSQVTSFSMPASTAEVVVATMPPSNWSGSPLGNLVGFAALVSGLATGTVTFRIRQGTTITGAVVGAAVPLTTAAAQINTPAMPFQDTSAFATGPQQAAQYVLTAQGSVNSVATLTVALLELETIAPIQ